MILRQFLHNDPVGISYLFGCGGKATGAQWLIPLAISTPICGRPTMPACELTSLSTPMFMPTTSRPAGLSPTRRGCLCALGAGRRIIPIQRRAGWRGPSPWERLGQRAAHARSHARAHIHSCNGSNPRGRAVVRLYRPHPNGRRPRPHRTCRECGSRCKATVPKREQVEGSS